MRRREADQPLAVLLQYGAIHMRQAIGEAIPRCPREYDAHVAITDAVANQQYQRRRFAAIARIGAREIDLRPHDQLHLRLLGVAEQLRHIEHRAVIGHGDRGHALLLAGREKLARKNRAALHRVVSVGVKMNELQGASQIWLQSPDAPGTSPIIITFQAVPARLKRESQGGGGWENVVCNSATSIALRGSLKPWVLPDACSIGLRAHEGSTEAAMNNGKAERC